MRKRLLIGLIMMCAIIFTGCVDADITVDLEKDGTGKAIVDVLGPQTIFDNIPQNTIDEWGKSFEKIEKVSELDKTGYKFTTRQGPIDEVLKEVTNLNDSIDKNKIDNTQKNKSNEVTDEQIQSESIETTTISTKNNSSTNNSTNSFANELYQKYVDVDEQKQLFSSTYNINLKLKDAIYSELTKEQRLLMNLLGRTANIGLHIKSPIEAEASNATSQTKENGKYIYNWEYTLDDVQNINFSAKVPNVRNIVIAAICVLVVLIIVIRFLFKRKK